ncbi:hypothetical protein MF672_011645 [Actinomadura sp. ATCC 31491]|uniref:DUF4064 domain-containing protein n=1 Tax=Actinomadura luzonensis TaxID=2805427 RepID=A0ABT0FR89_9ACTN|nr:hypothetical protein [Actinomadura luzonensis]MCK2214438.1 hypothetical protein [Actinomadura luzonensis]
MSNPPPPFPPPPPPGREPRNTGLIVGLAFAGVFGYLLVNLIVGIVALSVQHTAAIVVAAVFLASLGLGAGVTFLLLRKSWSIGLGLGLMLGWALASIVSAGFCTGLNPGLYS